MKLKPGYGYYDTTNYPLGGCFRRVPRDGPPMSIVKFETIDKDLLKRAHGMNATGETEDGIRIAFNTDSTEA